MSIIAVKGVPTFWTLEYITKNFSNLISGQFEPLHFTNGPSKTKICYIRISEKLDPIRVIEKINTRFPSKSMKKIEAFIPDSGSDIQMGKIKAEKKVGQQAAPSTGKPKKLPQRINILFVTHTELLMEIQARFPGLLNLSKKTGHKLLDEIATIIFQRLKVIMERNNTIANKPFLVTCSYRKSHPHSGDFQMIVSTLHKLQAEAGIPRTQVQQSELTAYKAQMLAIQNVPYEKVQHACDKFSGRIANKIIGHINELNTDEAPNESEEDKARRKIREELKKMTQFFPNIVNQVLVKHFIPDKVTHQRMRVYGSPFLPTRAVMQSYLKPFKPMKLVRSTRMYNLLLCEVPHSSLAAFYLKDGSVLSGATLMVRSSAMPMYQMPQPLKEKLAAILMDGPMNA